MIPIFAALLLLPPVSMAAPQPADLAELSTLSQDPPAYAARLLDQVSGDPGQFADRLNGLIGPWTDDGSTETPSAWAFAADLAGDGRPEWIANVPGLNQACAASDGQCLHRRFLCVHGRCPGTVVLIERTGRGFAPLASVGTLETPRLFGLQDLLGDGGAELVLSTLYCGAHTCFQGLAIGRWDGAAWHDLVADPMQQPTATIDIVPHPGGGPMDIVLHGGIVTSVGAGPQWTHTRTYVWRGSAYHLDRDEAEPDSHAYFRMLDANAALADADWSRALQLAQDAISFPNLTTDQWPQQPVPGRIGAYTVIEAMIAHAETADAAGVVALQPQLESYLNTSPDNPYAEAGRVFVAMYQQTGDPAAACHAMAEVVRQSWDQAQFYTQYGYTQERLAPERVCPM